MSATCGHDCDNFDGTDPAFKRALVWVIAINITMFLVELPMGFLGQSQALKADSLDFLGDSVTYAISLAVIGKTLQVRASAALFKGISLGLLGLWILGITIYRSFYFGEPDAPIMGYVGLAALLANLASVLILVKFKDGDANVRSVWICSRNDAINNVAVIISAGAVAYFASPWPDLIVAAIMAALFVSGSVTIIRQARAELKSAKEGCDQAHFGHHEG